MDLPITDLAPRRDLPPPANSRPTDSGGESFATLLERAAPPTEPQSDPTQHQPRPHEAAVARPAQTDAADDHDLTAAPHPGSNHRTSRHGAGVQEVSLEDDGRGLQAAALVTMPVALAIVPPPGSSAVEPAVIQSGDAVAPVEAPSSPTSALVPAPPPTPAFTPTPPGAMASVPALPVEGIAVASPDRGPIESAPNLPKLDPNRDVTMAPGRPVLDPSATPVSDPDRPVRLAAVASTPDATNTDPTARVAQVGLNRASAETGARPIAPRSSEAPAARPVTAPPSAVEGMAIRPAQDTQPPRPVVTVPAGTNASDPRTPTQGSAPDFAANSATPMAAVAPPVASTTTSAAAPASGATASSSSGDVLSPVVATPTARDVNSAGVKAPATHDVPTAQDARPELAGVQTVMVPNDGDTPKAPPIPKPLAPTNALAAQASDQGEAHAPLDRPSASLASAPGGPAAPTADTMPLTAEKDQDSLLSPAPPNAETEATAAATSLAGPSTDSNVPRPLAATQDPAAPARAMRAAHEGPTQQVAVQLSRAIVDGNDRITIKLSPIELGQIDVRMEIGPDGRVQAVFAADRPQTLELLQRDAKQLERALQESGLRADSSSLNFSLRGEHRDSQAMLRQALAGLQAASTLPSEIPISPAPQYARPWSESGRLDIRV